MPLPAGQGVGLIHAVEPAATIIGSMTAEAVEIIERLSGRGAPCA